MSGSHPGNICLCWGTVFIITTGGASANSMNRSWIMLNITGYRVHTTKMIWHQMSTATWINAQQHSLLEKCKSKLQWGITSHGAEWPSSKNIQARWWECKLTQSLWRTVWRFLKKKLITELPEDPKIPLLGIYPEKIVIQKDTCTLMFTAVLFTIARTWKPPKCP